MVSDGILTPRKRAVLLPLLAVLKTMKPEHRVIVLSHFDDVTRDAIYEAITHVLLSERIPFRKRLELRRRLRPYKNELRGFSDSGKSSTWKKRQLVQMGAGPMTHVLRATVPLLLDLYAP